MTNPYTVAQITNYIRNMFTQDFVLQSVRVSGEVSNCKYHSSGHIYFTLKDEKASIACVMFASDARGLKFRLEDGSEIEVRGRIDIFERDGRYQLYAKSIRLQGEGALYERFAALKAQLEERGMFAPEYKRPIPRYIKSLGVVTAPTGAAVRDIIQIARRRNPSVQIILCPAQVQGNGAAESIVRSIHRLEGQGVDLIIVGRGGGSIEDLWAFNEEIVAEAIFECEVPIISAVGHETDFTIADFVADMRAPTPSAAAELAVYERDRLREQINSLGADLKSAMFARIDEARRQRENRRVKLGYLSPENQTRQKRLLAISLEERLELAIKNVLKDKRHRLEIYIGRLKGLSPLEKLNQGYSIAIGQKGKRLRSIGDVAEGDKISLYVSDGYIDAVVEETHGNS